MIVGHRKQIVFAVLFTVSFAVLCIYDYFVIGSMYLLELHDAGRRPLL